MRTEPIHVVEIDGMELRLFASPRYQRSGQADLPWHSADDLRAILRLPDDLREAFQRKMKSDWDEVRTIATDHGITTIAPHFMAEGMIDFLLRRESIMSDEDRVRIRGSYRRGITAATKAMVPHLSPMQRMLFALSATEEN